jgi:hypothetical protein
MIYYHKNNVKYDPEKLQSVEIKGKEKPIKRGTNLRTFVTNTFSQSCERISGTLQIISKTNAFTDFMERTAKRQYFISVLFSLQLKV